MTVLTSHSNGEVQYWYDTSLTLLTIRSREVPFLIFLALVLKWMGTVMPPGLSPSLLSYTASGAWWAMMSLLTR